MGGMHTLRQLAVTAACLAAQLQPALALPQVNVVNPTPMPWVTVDAAGVGATITPQVVTNNGAKSTISQAPESLRTTSSYALHSGTTTTMYTGLPPVATATGFSNEAGAFLACSDDKREDMPFCLPKRGAILAPGLTYYVTWNPSFFGENQSEMVTLNVEYVEVADSSSYKGKGFKLSQVPASRGFYAWTIDSTFLPSDRSVIGVNLTLLRPDTTTVDNPDDFQEVPGVTVLVSNNGEETLKKSPAWMGAGSGPNVVAIVVPVVIALVVLLFAGFCFWSWRRHGTVPLVGAVGGKLARRRSSGYGVRKSRSERMGEPATPTRGGAGAIDVKLTDRDSWSPTSPSQAHAYGGGGDARGPYSSNASSAPAAGQGRNIFREELQRQERQR
ncbi:hypothetical protein B0H63DRAFT_196166 [Podospora didyma]|uniref:Uncharacterized protein n=1 Tax=Podospora didyma TaxID=330526 RepID=A0AAE0TVI7_9PEZI|nr:hypothetical protein B0H63DRAFT_196166 [Podospora didyma]